MPFLRIQTNVELSEEKKSSILARASLQVSTALQKDEAFFMGAAEGSTAMIFGGRRDPAAMLEVASLGFPDGSVEELSRLLCHLMKEEAGVAEDRIYIRFVDAERSLWGWNSKVF
ncbi:MAG: phenylpyruvate tautomerase MIF-related protein [Verrucomicrobiota bacterium]